MQIIIPMSGFGERFRQAGYKLPKPLIDVDGRPIISYVTEMFPGADRFIFVCNSDHLANPAYGMVAALRQCAPEGVIVPISPHKLGPVHAVKAAEAQIDPTMPTVVNYCDFTCYWDFNEFKDFVAWTDCDGAIPAYKGFHPHSLGSTFYAYLKHTQGWLDDIQEKQPFTESPIEEYASSGTYYFKSGQLCLDAMSAQLARENLMVGNEYYASLTYKILLESNKKVAVYPLQHFMQWGTPYDLEQYLGWSKVFRDLSTDHQKRAHHGGAVLIPMAGLGQRFSQAGYTRTKPLIPVSGRPMVIQATLDLPDAPIHRFVLRRDVDDQEEIARKLRSSFTGAELKLLPRVTEGQAITCLEGIDSLDPEKPVTIGACDNGVIYDVEVFTAVLADPDVDVIVWAVRGHAAGKAKPEMFGWVETDEHGKVSRVVVKERLSDPEQDAMIIGTFTFKKTGDFRSCIQSLVERDCRVNGEFYVDSLIEDAITAGLKVQVFEVDAYIGWGTPNDLKTFEYWQSCLHKWSHHPYRLEKDRRVPQSKLSTLERDYAHVKPTLPAGDYSVEKQVLPSVTAGELTRFLPVGIIAVLIDFFAYMTLLVIGVTMPLAKASSFVAGAVFAYFGNRNFTFKREAAGRSSVALFASIYLGALVANVGVNQISLQVLESVGILELSIKPIAFIIATGVSAALNFFGMKLFVFRGQNIN